MTALVEVAPEWETRPGFDGRNCYLRFLAHYPRRCQFAMMHRTPFGRLLVIIVPDGHLQLSFSETSMKRLPYLDIDHVHCHIRLAVLQLLQGSVRKER